MTSEIHFASWVQHGLAAAVSQPADASGRRKVAPSVALSVSRGAQDEPHDPPATAPVVLLGPGDVVGVDPSQVLRRSPRPDEHDLEPNYLALIEFARADLPWMFSADTGTAERATPWLMLVVVPAERARIRNRPRSLNPELVVADPADLPDPADAWAFAHVQVVGLDKDGAAGELRTPASPRLRSRLLSPTRLHPETVYVAALVPTYEAGRLAGLGEDPTSAGAALWRPAATSELPAYDHWGFRTAPRGDFEMLAERLHMLPPEKTAVLGHRRVAIDPVASGMFDSVSAFEPCVIDVATAIARGSDGDPARAVAPSALAPDSVTLPAASTIHARIKQLTGLAAQEEADEPIVAPPLYGQWAAMVESIDGVPGTDLAPVPASTGQAWIRQLNADPALRIAAGAGARVVTHNQEAFMRQAWAQLSDVMTANQRMRWAQLFAHALGTIHAKLSELSEEDILRLLAPATGRIRSGDRTVHAELERSTLPREAVGAALARVSRFAVRAAKRPVEVTIGTTARAAALALRNGEHTVLPRRLVDQAFQRRETVDLAGLRELITSNPVLEARVTSVVGDVSEFLSRAEALPEPADAPPRRLTASALDQPALARLIRKLGRGQQSVTSLRRVADLDLTAMDSPRLGRSHPDLRDLVREVTPADLEVIAGMVTQTQSPGAVAKVTDPIDLPELAAPPADATQALLTRLEPVRAYGEMLDWAHRFTSERVRRRLAEAAAVSPYTPAMAAPAIPGALAERLRDLDPDWVLGGLGALEPNTLCVLQVNHPFVEACLAGANHELARELLWRGYPTDLRGTCFRSFWEYGQPDILPMDQWRGDIGSQHEAAAGPIVVIVLKGDLLRRYPRTIVTAELGRVDGTRDQPTFTSERVAEEVLRGSLGADVTYVGLAIDYATLTTRHDDDRYGWFISLLEPADEPRFGLDERGPDDPATPNAGRPADEWTWDGVASTAMRGAHLLPAALDVADTEGSAAVAGRLFQTPFRVLLKAIDYVA